MYTVISKAFYRKMTLLKNKTISFVYIGNQTHARALSSKCLTYAL